METVDGIQTSAAPELGGVAVLAALAYYWRITAR